MSRPGDKDSGGVDIREDNHSVHWSSNDPLYNKKAKSVFDVWAYYAFDGDAKKAYETLRTRLYEGLRLWVRTTSFAELIPEDRRSEIYRTDSTDTRVADGVLDMMALSGKLAVNLGKHRLGKQAGVSCNTAQAALGRLTGWLFDVQINERGGLYVSFSKSFQETNLVSLLRSIIDAGGSEWNQYQNEYSERKADEPFLSGTSQFIKRQAQGIAAEQGEAEWVAQLDRVQKAYGEIGLSIITYLRKHGSSRARTLIDTCGANVTLLSRLRSDNVLAISNTGVLGLADEFTAALTVDPREVLRERFFSALGETGLRILDALARCGEMEASELASETGKKISGLRGSLRKLEELGLVLAEREKATDPKVYSLADDIWDKLETLAPQMKTFTIASQRENLRLRDGQRWAMKAKRVASVEEKTQLDRKIEKLATRRVPHLARIFADLGLDNKALREMAGDENKMVRAHGVNQPVSPQPAKLNKLERLHGQARVELTAQRQIEVGLARARLVEIAQGLQKDGIPRWDWYRHFTLAGYSGKEAGQFLAETKGVALCSA